MLRFNLPFMLDVLSHQELLMGFFLMGAGLSFMLLGARVARTLVAMSFGVIGFVMGGLLLTTPEFQLLGGLVIALGLGATAAYVVRPAAAVLAGSWAAAVVLIALSGAASNHLLLWTSMAFAAVAAIALTFILFHGSVAVVTSFEGTLMFLAGLAICVSRSPMVWIHFRNMLLNNPVFGLFLLLAGTTTGVCLQLAEIQRKNVGGT